MSEFALSLLTTIAKAIITETVKAIAKRISLRKKERTAPTHNRDGSDDVGI